jgi:hypothetical protein
MSTGFDLSAWKQQAQGELKRLEEEEKRLVEELGKVQAEKTQISEALGIRTTPRRRRYRTAIQELFEKDGVRVEMTVEDVIGDLFDGDSSVTQGVKVSMARLSKDNELYSYDSSTGTLLYEPPAKAKTAKK